MMIVSFECELYCALQPNANLSGVACNFSGTEVHCSLIRICMFSYFCLSWLDIVGKLTDTTLYCWCAHLPVSYIEICGLCSLKYIVPPRWALYVQACGLYLLIFYIFFFIKCVHRTLSSMLCTRMRLETYKHICISYTEKCWHTKAVRYPCCFLICAIQTIESTK